MNYWLIISITLVLSAFFSGMEIAFISSNKLKIELDKKHGLLYAKVFSRLINQPHKFISSMLVGNNVVVVIYSIMMAAKLEPFINHYMLYNYTNDVLLMILQTLISTIIILFVAEFIPKTFFQLHSNATLRFFAFPAVFSYYLFYPIVYITSLITRFILKNGFNVEFNETKLVFDKIDLETYIEESSSKSHSTREHEIQMFQNVMDFANVKLRECMLPRTEIVAIEVTEPIEALRAKFVETELSRILVYRDSIDNIIGYVHSHEIFKNPEYIGSVLLSLPIVPESMPANKMLTMFIQQRKSIALVVDEFGGTAGLVTMEDIIEEIIGEIEDEHDVDDLTDMQIAPNEYLFSGRSEIDFINKKYELNLPESEDYETLGGLIFTHYQSIPHKNDEIMIGTFLFVIQEVSDTRIEMVKLITELK